MRCRPLIPLLFLLLFAAPASADEDDPIDQALDACLQGPTAGSTQGMVECIGTAYEAWDTALNQAYRDLLKQLTAEQAELLKTSQRQWLAFRDNERKFLGSPQQPPAGSIMRLVTNEAAVALVKARVLGLRSYRESLGEP